MIWKMINNNYSTLIWGCATVRLCLNHNISLVVENDGNRNNINLINLTWFIFNVFSIRKDIFRFFTRSPMPGIWIMETEAKLELLLSGLRHLLPLSLRKKQKRNQQRHQSRARKKRKANVWVRVRYVLKCDNCTADSRQKAKREEEKGS